MLIDPIRVENILAVFNIKVTGVLHLGAHECEEMTFYKENLGLSPDTIIWVDALQECVDAAKARGIPNVYQAVLDEVERDTVFHITNNKQSSSLLEFGTHANNYAYVKNTEHRDVKTQTLATFVEKNQLNIKKYNFWNLDLQGMDTAVLKGGEQFLQYVDCVYIEVNTENVYNGNGLLEETDTLLKQHGLTRKILHMTSCGWGDALYLRK